MCKRPKAERIALAMEKVVRPVNLVTVEDWALLSLRQRQAIEKEPWMSGIWVPGWLLENQSLKAKAEKAPLPSVQSVRSPNRKPRKPRFNKDGSPRKKHQPKAPSEKTKAKLAKIKLSQWREAYRIFLESPYWKTVRMMVFKRDGEKCRKCGGEEMLQCHHLTYAHHGLEHRHLEDMVTLCRSCHAKEHGR